jgi:diaminopimelate decarboxylase
MSQIITTPAWAIPGFLEARENNHLYRRRRRDRTDVQIRHAALCLFGSAHPRQHRPAASGRQQVDRPIKFCYASKANSNMAVLGVVRIPASTSRSTAAGNV